MSSPKNRRSKKTSSGSRRSVVAGVREAAAVLSEFTHAANLHAAWKKNQNPWVTVAGPEGVTNTPFVRIKANKLWGDPRRRKIVEETTEETND